MVIDENKNITDISYNHNLPITITFGNGNTIGYLYDTAGVKVGKTITTDIELVKTDYLSGYQYVDEGLQFFPTAEGYVKAVPSRGGRRYIYVFNYLDHLGNVRVSYGVDGLSSQKVTILEENHYYPFGLKHKNYNVTKLKYEFEEELLVLNQTVSTGYNYKLNGKEWQDELGLNVYDYGYRGYDPAIGRWSAIDPLAEKYITTSPYVYVQNSPLVNREIDGRYFEKGSKSERQAARIERRAEKRADKLEKQANKLIKDGKSAGDLMDRVAELRNSAQDVREMRSNTSTEFKYSKVGSKEFKKENLAGPTTTQTGTNAKGDNVVTMFVEGNMGNQIHETRHGGDVARGNLSFDNTGGYGVSHEISAYRAQYSYDGSLSYRDTPTLVTVQNRLQIGQDPTKGVINNINQINANIVNSMVDPGFRQIYPPTDVNGAPIIPLSIWNSN